MWILKKISGILSSRAGTSKENQINENANFLDLNINIQNSRFLTKHYDKGEKFNFNIIRIPNKSCST